MSELRAKLSDTTHVIPAYKASREVFMSSRPWGGLSAGHQAGDRAKLLEYSASRMPFCEATDHVSGLGVARVKWTPAKEAINVTHTRITVATFTLFATAALATAQARQGGSNSPTPSSPQTPAVSVQPTVTLVGCLYREDQVPGRKPNVAERAGILEDYILAGASAMSTQAQPGAAAPAPTGTSGSALTTGNMYKVENIPDERLKALVGKRVEVTGRIDAEGSPTRPAGPGPDRGLGPDRINLPEFEASSIQETAGTCPAAPAPMK
jgi:hypothetical protein